MDPKACLDRAAQIIRDGGDRMEAAMALTDYRVWRAKGGFEPAGGDKLYRRLSKRMERDFNRWAVGR